MHGNYMKLRARAGRSAESIVLIAMKFLLRERG